MVGGSGWGGVAKERGEENLGDRLGGSAARLGTSYSKGGWLPISFAGQWGFKVLCVVEFWIEKTDITARPFLFWRIERCRAVFDDLRLACCFSWCINLQIVHRISYKRDLESKLTNFVQIPRSTCSSVGDNDRALQSGERLG